MRARLLAGLSVLALGCGHGSTPASSDGGDGGDGGHVGAGDLASTANEVTLQGEYVAPELVLGGQSPFSGTPAFSLLTASGAILTGTDGAFDIAVGSTFSTLTAATSDTLPTRGPVQTAMYAAQGATVYVIVKTGTDAATLAVQTVGGPTQAQQVASGACIVSVLTSEVPRPVPATATLTASVGDVYSIAYDQGGNASALQTTNGAASGLFLVTNTTSASSVTLQATGGLTWAPLTCPFTPGYITYETDVAS